MTTRTSADLATKILENLQVVPEGMAPQIEDVGRLTANLPSLMAQLAAEEIVYVPDIDAIPDAWFLALADLAAYRLRKQFGASGDLETTLKNAYDDAFSSIKVMTRGKPTYEALKVLNF